MYHLLGYATLIKKDECLNSYAAGHLAMIHWENELGGFISHPLPLTCILKVTRDHECLN